MKDVILQSKRAALCESEGDKNNLCHWVSLAVSFHYPFRPGSLRWSGNTPPQHVLLLKRFTGRHVSFPLSHIEGEGTQ